MPYPNEHAARIREPGDFIEDSFARTSITEGVDLVVGHLVGGDGSAVGQAYRFDREVFTAREARQWLKDHDVKPILFEEATGGEKAYSRSKCMTCKDAGPVVDVHWAEGMGRAWFCMKDFKAFMAGDGAGEINRAWYLPGAEAPKEFGGGDAVQILKLEEDCTDEELMDRVRQAAEGGKAIALKANMEGAMVALFLPAGIPPVPIGLPRGSKPEAADNRHITLAYLGPDASQLPVSKELVVGMLSRLAAAQPPIEGEVSGIGRFAPEEDDECPFYASFDSPDLPAFRQRVVDMLEAAGVPVVKDHGFTPHVTLAYLPKNAPTPDYRPDPVSVVFKDVTLAWGGERYPIAFAGEPMASKQDKPFKTVDGVRLHAEDFASVGDPEEPGSWKLPLAEQPGTVSETRIAGAITALQPGGFRGRHVELTAPKATVVRRISAAIGKLEDEDAQERLRDRLDAVKQVTDPIVSADKATLDGEVSREQQETAVRRAFDAALHPPMGQPTSAAPSGPWVVDTYPGSVVCEWAGKFYQVPFMREGTEILFAAQEDWIEVEKREEWIRKLKELQKAGRRVRSEKLGVLRELKAKLEDLFKSLTDVVGWAGYEDRDKGSTFQSVKVFRTQSGEDWLLTWTTNAFLDRDGEIFETKAIEEYVARHGEDPVKGDFEFWHIPGSKFGQIRWQGVSGRFLAEAGPFDETVVGQAFKEFFQEFPDGHPVIAPEGWGTSHGFQFRPEDPKGGVYRWFEKKETSVLPGSVAANPYNPELEVIQMLNEKQIEALREIGGDPLVKLVTETGEKVTSQLEQAGIAFKAKGGGDLAQQIRAMADEMEDEDMAKQLRGMAAQVAKATGTKETGSKPASEAEAEPAPAGEKLGLKQLVASLRGLAAKAKGDAKAKLDGVASTLEQAAVEEPAPVPAAETPVSRAEMEGAVQVLGQAIAGVIEQVKMLREAMGVEVRREVKQTLDETPRLSLQELAAKSVIGKEETRVDGRKELARTGPKETPAEEPAAGGRLFGIPFLQSIKSANRAYGQPQQPKPQ